MRWILLASLLLFGCDSPGLGCAGAEVTRVEVDGNRFSLRRSGDVVQAIRTNFVRRPDISLIGYGAERAIEATYGCTVTKMRGDVALMVAQLDCDRALRDGDRARWVRPKRSQLSCLGDIFSSGPSGREEIEFTCF